MGVRIERNKRETLEHQRPNFESDERILRCRINATFQSQAEHRIYAAERALEQIRRVS
jgi:hypothetical protein